LSTITLCFVVCLMVFNATFNNISVISWRSVLLVEEIGGPGENHRPVASHWQTLSHNVVHLALIEIRTHNISDCIGSCNCNLSLPFRSSLLILKTVMLFNTYIFCRFVNDWSFLNVNLWCDLIQEVVRCTCKKNLKKDPTHIYF